jgi:hypothetical protein
MQHKRLIVAVSVGVLVLLAVTACAAVPTAPGDGQVISPSAFGPTFDSLSLPAFDLFATPVANEMRAISLAHTSERLTSEQLYNAFYAGVGGCDRHHDLFLQEDLGAAGDAPPGN